jgi:hypothetical protein
VNIKTKVTKFGFTWCFVWALNLISNIKRRHGLRVFETRALRGIFGPQEAEGN